MHDGINPSVTLWVPLIGGIIERTIGHIWRNTHAQAAVPPDFSPRVHSFARLFVAEKLTVNRPVRACVANQ